MARRAGLGAVALLTAAAAAAATGTSGAAPGATPRGGVPATVEADFDGDGRADLAVGVPGARVAGADEAGAVHVLYGGAAGLGAAETWDRAAAGVVGPAAAGDNFGWAVAAGDFNGDGRADLAVGAPNADAGSNALAGTVNVLYGAAGGLTAAGDHLWSRDVPGVQGGVAGNSNFGQTLAPGDFDGDGYDDLGIGVPDATVAGEEGAGALNVLYGTPVGLSAAGDQVWDRSTPGVLGAVGSNVFALGIAAGDFDGDGRDDLAAGVPYDPSGGVGASGAVNVLYGSAGGLTAAGDQLWHRGQPGVDGGPRSYDCFGWSVAAGDFDGDGRADLAVGVPGCSLSGYPGSVHVLYGSGGGLAAAGDQLWHRGQPGVAGTPRPDDLFGWAVAAADFDGDGRSDLAVGVRGDDVYGVADAGSAQVLYGTGGGLAAAGDQIWHREQPGVAGAARTGDRFGWAVGADDFDGDGRPDLVVGAPWDNVAGVPDAGAANVLYGSAGGVTTAGDELWSRPLDGSVPLTEDWFGFSVGG